MHNWSMESRALIAGGETFTTEFKRSDISAKDLTKAVACLANGEGGVLLIGVDDDGTVVGNQSLSDLKRDQTK